MFSCLALFEILCIQQYIQINYQLVFVTKIKLSSTFTWNTWICHWWLFKPSVTFVTQFVCSYAMFTYICKVKVQLTYNIRIINQCSSAVNTGLCNAIYNPCIACTKCEIITIMWRGVFYANLYYFLVLGDKLYMGIILLHSIMVAYWANNQIFTL